MLDHVSIGVRDADASKRFYDAALKPLGYTCLSQSPGSLGYGAQGVALWVNEAARPVPADEKSGLHFCFAAPTRASVDAFHAGALARRRQRQWRAGPARRLWRKLLRRLCRRPGRLSPRGLLQRCRLTLEALRFRPS